MRTQLKSPVKYARSRRGEPMVAVAIFMPEHPLVHLVYPQRNVFGVVALYRALMNALKCNGLLPSDAPGTYCATRGVNDSTYLFAVTQRAPALETLKGELRAVCIHDPFLALGYWCDEEGIFRTWHPTPAKVDLHAALMLADWDARMAEAEALMSRLQAEADKAGANGGDTGGASGNAS